MTYTVAGSVLTITGVGESQEFDFRTQSLAECVMSLLLLGAGSPPVVIPAPVANWRLDGTLNDSSGNAHTLSVTAGSAGYVASPGGQALGGAGVTCTTESASFSMPRIDQNPLTLAVRAKALTAGDIASAGVTLRSSTTNTLSITIGAETNPTTVSVTADVQTFLGFYESLVAADNYVTAAFVTNGAGNWSIYFNGVSVASGATVSVTTGVDKAIVDVGSEGGGAIEWVRIWDVALTAAQVAAL